MDSFVSRYKNALVLILVLVAQLLALAIQAKRPAGPGSDQPTVSLLRYAVVAVVTPPERLIVGTGLWARSLWTGYIDLIHVRKQNAALRQQILRLRIEQAGLAQDAAQGQRLEHLLDFKQHYIYKTLPAQIIGTSGTDQSRVLYIDQGSHDGLKQDMPVITADGIVGKIKDVFPHTSQVLLITDPTSGVGVVLQTTRTRGILKGRAYGQLQVVDVSPDSRIKPGETILTSGGDQIFPRGLPVGTVERIVPDPQHDPLVDILVHPAAHLAALEEVLVVTNVGNSQSPQEAKDIAESEAESVAAQKRASDILSERLPSRYDPNAPADTNPQTTTDANGNPIRPPAPPAPVHPDQFSPDAEPAAADMTPGHRWAPVKGGAEDTSKASQPTAAQQTSAANAGTTVTAQPQQPAAAASNPQTSAPQAQKQAAAKQRRKAAPAITPKNAPAPQGGLR
ncbi:MAG TPA: rod shape-determining protein MreC [Acidobacteriaceae bacterium]|nr:rod shape-determining protein MreC [Acidobacteriaceae bacterium]